MQILLVNPFLKWLQIIFYLLDKKTSKNPIKLTPVVKSLKGSLKNADIDEDDYKSYLEDKYL